MQITLLGTAAAEGFPAPFCDCQACTRARYLGGRDLRTRSGAWIDNALKIDFSADTVIQAQRLGRSLAGVRSIVITHDHSDHWLPQELRWLGAPFSTSRAALPPVEVWGTPQVLARLEHDCLDFPPGRSRVLPRLIEAGTEFTTASGHHILGLPADHSPEALLFRIEAPTGAACFYGHDSGLWPQLVFEALANRGTLGCVLLDCTNGGTRSENRGHMGIDGVVQMVERLNAEGCLAKKAICVATHFSHNGGLDHQSLTERLATHGILAAWDGMQIEIT